jgi:two-component system chemotaxis response regulator CheY
VSSSVPFIAQLVGVVPVTMFEFRKPDIELPNLTLREAGFEVSEAEDGKKALAALQVAPVDVVITDLNMPNMDGVTLIRSLRTLPAFRSTPILMLTTEFDAAKKAEGKSAGATGWLVKPFDPKKLIDVVNRVLG